MQTPAGCTLLALAGLFVATSVRAGTDADSNPPASDSPALRVSEKAGNVADWAGLGTNSLEAAESSKSIEAQLLRRGADLHAPLGDDAHYVLDAAADTSSNAAERLGSYAKALGRVGTAAEVAQAAASAADCVDTPAERRSALSGGCGKLVEQAGDKVRYALAGEVAPVVGPLTLSFVDTVVDPAYKRYVSDDGRTLRETFTDEIAIPYVIAPALGLEHSDELDGYATHRQAAQARQFAATEQAREEHQRLRAYELQDLATRASVPGPLPTPDPFNVYLQQFMTTLQDQTSRMQRGLPLDANRLQHDANQALQHAPSPHHDCAAQTCGVP